jgi:hypothetical protein
MRMGRLADPPVIDVPVNNVISDSQLNVDTNKMLAANDQAAWSAWLQPPKVFILLGIGAVALYFLMKKR